MSDSNNGQDMAEGTAAAMPTENKPAEDVQQPVLPDGVKERTKEEFEKLKASNQVLSEKLKALEGSKPTFNSVFDELRPNAVAAPTVAAPLPGNQVIDEGGYVDAALLNSTLSKAQKEAQEARSIALQTQESIQRFQETQVVQAVHKDFPELDPNNKDHFDPSFYDYVKNDLVGQLMQGKNQDLRAAAEKARQVLAKQEVPQQSRKETISSREQASAPTGTGNRVEPPTNDEQIALVEGTRKGDKDAIFKRLQASGY